MSHYAHHHHGHAVNSADTEVEQPTDTDAESEALDAKRIADSLPLTAAAKATGLSRSKIRRTLDAGSFPNAFQVESGGQHVWRVPVDDLLNAGFSVSVGGLSAMRRQNLPDVIDLTDGASDQLDVRGSQMNASAVAVADGFRKTLHDLATESAAAKAGKAAAEAKLEVREEQLADTRAERDRYARMLDDASTRRRVFGRRRKRIADQPTPATEPTGASPDDAA